MFEAHDNLGDLISAVRQHQVEQQAAQRQPVVNAFLADVAAELPETVRDALAMSYRWDEERGPTAIFYVDGKQWSIYRIKTGSFASRYDLPGSFSWVVQLEARELFSCSRSQLRDKLLLAIDATRHT
jgi:hypothetical protein